LIYGRLQGSNAGGQTIRLYAHVPGRPGYSSVGRTTTFPDGFYEFTRPAGVVFTNRDWFVLGPSGSRSRTVHEHVAALVTLKESTSVAVTGQRVNVGWASPPVTISVSGLAPVTTLPTTSAG
jgi:hypothetical protein